MTDRPNPLKAVRESVESRPCRALTLVELLVVVVVLGVLLAMLLPNSLVRRPRSAPRIHCLNNLKQVSLSFQIFALDNEGRFPVEVSTAAGGAKEHLESAADGRGIPSHLFWAFVSLSNELSTPRVLVCPADRQRQLMTNFTALAFTTPLAQGGQNAAVSYFVNLAADESRPAGILVGDRHFSTVSKGRSSDHDAFFGIEHRIRPGDVKPGGGYAKLDFHPTLHSDSRTRARRGNLGMVDGSVQRVEAPRDMVRVRERIGTSTNDHRLLFPFVPGKND